MKRLARVLLTMLFAVGCVPFLESGGAVAEEKVAVPRAAELPAISGEEADRDMERLRRENEMLKKEMEALRQVIQQLKEERLTTQEAEKEIRAKAAEEKAKADQRLQKVVEQLSLAQEQREKEKADETLPKAVEQLRLQMEDIRQEKEQRLLELEQLLKKTKDAVRQRDLDAYKALHEALQAKLDSTPSVPAEAEDSYRAALDAFALRSEEKELEDHMLSLGDAGLVTMLRFEKARACRKAGMYAEAVNELNKVIEQNLSEALANAARWTLVEILQEQKKREEAIAELEKILLTTNDARKKKDAIYGIINLAGRDLEAKIRAIDRLIFDLEKGKERTECQKRLRQLYLAEREYAKHHDGYLSKRLSDLYPEYVDRLEVFTCPSVGGPKIGSKEEIDSKTSYILVMKGQPAETFGGKAVWICESPENHAMEGGHAVFNVGSVEWLKTSELLKIIDESRKRELPLGPIEIRVSPSAKHGDVLKTIEEYRKKEGGAVEIRVMPSERQEGTGTGGDKGTQPERTPSEPEVREESSGIISVR